MLAHNQMAIKALSKSALGGLRDLREQKASQRYTKSVRTSASSCTSISLVLVLVTGLTYQSALRARADEKANSTALKLAGEIALHRPALVGLQEVALWRTGPLHLSAVPPSAVVVLYDQLKLLLNDLANQYELVTVQTLMDAEVPVVTGTGLAGPTGFDVL